MDHAMGCEGNQWSHHVTTNLEQLVLMDRHRVAVAVVVVVVVVVAVVVAVVVVVVVVVVGVVGVGAGVGVVGVGVAAAAVAVSSSSSSSRHVQGCLCASSSTLPVFRRKPGYTSSCRMSET